MRDGTNWRQQEAARWLLISLAGDAAEDGYWIKVDAEDEEKFGGEWSNVHLYAYVGANYCWPCAKRDPQADAALPRWR